MRILLLSDSHSRELPDFSGYDAVIHCGDYGKSYGELTNAGVTFVRGNCDTQGTNEILMDLFGRKVFITHGHHYGVKEGYDRIIYRAMELGASVVMFGHTHIPIHKEEEGLLVLNPGAWMDGFIIEILDDRLVYSMEGKVYKEFKFKW